jgi:alkaline phosphatase
MPIQGMQTTYDSYALMTDSASSATAFGSGLKTRSGIINMDPETQTTCYKSVAQLAHESGRKVGVISSVSLDHATPAAYYASVTNRGLMNSIGTQLAESGYEFFGGGGLVSPKKAAREGDTENDVWDLLSANGYTVLNDRASILGLKTHPIDKVVAINPTLDGSSAMPYAIDRPKGNLSLKEMVEVAIANLEDRPRKRWDKERGPARKGFFLMVEGGKIDWACHANDAVATINDMLDFDAAVAVALEFASRHPAETLVVVTGDHETGGMTIGHATTAYKAHYDLLMDQTSSFDHFGNTEWAEHKEAHGKSLCAKGTQANDNLASDGIMLDYMSDIFGLEFTKLNDYQKEKLEDAYDKSMCSANDNSDDENKLLYGGYEPIIVTITHILNEIASVGWTSYSHTGVPVPVYAQGLRQYQFTGFYDNTDIAKRLANIMRLPKMPATKACPSL